MKNLPIKKLKRSINYGDIITLGRHKLLCGDACDKELISKFLKGVKINQVLCDVPYGVAAVESKNSFKSKLGNNKIIANDQYQSDEEYANFTQKWLDAVKPYLATKNTAYIFNSDKMIFALRQGMLNAGFHFSQLLVWVKSQPVIGRLDYQPQHELIAYCWFGRHQFLKSKDKSVIFYPKPSKSLLHPTMKPVGLIRRLILNNTKIGDIVYDCFSGSGSTLIAAEQTKRTCYAVELDAEYCQTIIDRYNSLTTKL